MNEYEQAPRIEPAPQPNELEIREATIEERIEAGITAAHDAKGEIDLITAMEIAETLGQAVGEDSSLARFGNSGVGGYLALREEYLDLYNSPETPDEVKRWIDWFGTFLVQREGTKSEHSFTNEAMGPQLERVLVHTVLQTERGDQRAYVPATLTAKEIIALTARLDALEEINESAFRAFLTLADVNAADLNLVESFRETHIGSWTYIEDAVRELTEIDGLEQEIRNLTKDRGLPEESLMIDYAVLEDHARETYDLVNEGWQIHAFSK